MNTKKNVVLENDNRAALLTVVSKTIKGTSFIGLRNYQNSLTKKTIKPQVANFTYLVGFDYPTMLKKDLTKLNEFCISSLETSDKKWNEALFKAYNELILSLQKRLASDEVKEILRANNDSTINRSEAQKNAYTRIGKGIKFLNFDRNGKAFEKGRRPVYVAGLMIRKTIIVKGEYLPTNSQLKTIAKRAIAKKLDIASTLYYKNFKICNENELNLQGITI